MSPDDSIPASSESQKPAVPTAAVPDDLCGWIPVAEVEAIVGRLAEPPKKQEGCRYTLTMPEAVRAQRHQEVQAAEKLRDAFEKLGAAPQPAGGSLANYQSDPKTYAFTLAVDINGNLAGELATDAVAKRFGAERRADPTASSGKPDVGTTAGWDSVGLAPYGFSARIGHIQISVDGQAPDVPRAPLQAVAAKVRDRIPDLPFAATNLYQVPRAGARDVNPCSLVTRQEAEAVLGKLLVDPYRASSYYPPLVHNQGQSCGYFTSGHHVFVITPTWSGGKQRFGMDKGMGGLVGFAAPQQGISVIEGPWEQTQTSATTGALLFLKGDRLLEVHYLTSTASRADTIKLAAQAMQRLSP